MKHGIRVEIGRASAVACGAPCLGLCFLLAGALSGETVAKVGGIRHVPPLNSGEFSHTGVRASREATQDKSAPRFIVHTIDGPLTSAPLERLGEDWSIGLGGAVPRSLAGNEWVSLRRDGLLLPPFPTRNTAR